MASLALDAAPSDGGFTLHPNANAAYAAKSVVGGRCVDAAGVNSGMLRCPVCFSRLVSQRGVLTERSGEEASLWNPSREEAEAGTEAEAEAAVAGGGETKEGGDGPGDGDGDGKKVVVAANRAADAPDGEAGLTWSETKYAWWWRVEDVDMCSNVALSHMVESPRGLMRLVVCCECRSGPLGYQLVDAEGGGMIWFPAAVMRQQDAVRRRRTEREGGGKHSMYPQNV